MIPQTISHYSILKKLGAGGMGEIYLAQDTRLGRPVALKLLPSAFTKDEDRLRRFEQEARAASALNHPNILTIFEIGQVDGTHYIATEFIDGETLRQRLTGARIKLGEALEIAIQVASALAAAHAAGIVHRDIKPENIMVRNDGYIKVLDFGLAKLTDPLGPTVDPEAATRALVDTDPGVVMGTACYMSPEQAQGRAVDGRTDIWSLGVVLYEMVTGHAPFEGATKSHLIVSILEKEPPLLAQYVREVPAELERIVSKALRKDREERYQVVKDLALDLKSLKQELEFEAKLERSVSPEMSGATTARSGAHGAAETSVQTAARSSEAQALHPTSSAEYLVSELKRHKRGAIIALMAVVIAMAAGLALWTYWRQPESAERIPIAVADFVNETDEKELNGLSGMLITSLEQSRRLAVLTRPRMFDILKSLGKGETDRIDETLGREICSHANVSALVVASIRRFDQLYTIDLKVLDPQKNEYLFAAKEEGQGKSSIPAMIDKLSEKTRIGLNEKAAELQAARHKVADVTTANLEAYQHYFQGEQLINKLKFRESEEEFKKAIALDPSFALAHYRLAYAMEWFGGERSKEPIAKAMQYIEKAPEKERYLIRALSAQIGRRFDEALAINRELLKSYPEEKEALWVVGDLSYHRNDLDAARAYLEKVLALDPAFERALQHITWTYRDLEQYDKALEYAKQYVARAPSEESYGALADAYNLKADFGGALEASGRGLELFPNSALLIQQTGYTHVLRNDYAKAEEEFKKLLAESRPLRDKRNGYWDMANLYRYLGKYRETLRMIDHVIESNVRLDDKANLALAHVVRAIILIEGWNKREEAERAVEKGLDLKDAAHRSFYNPLYGYYLLTGEYEKASSLAKNQLALSCTLCDVEVGAYFHRAKGEYDAAIRGFQVITQRDFMSSKLLGAYDLAKTYYEAGQYESAIEAAQRAQNIHFYAPPRAYIYPRTFLLLAKIYEKKGDKRRASENYE
ncbi:MAG TPA: protein kinase, partial [Pyrinomonadaceae bacterium]|nr:protein kinase [Pyrinomonadaceae bacterium]